MSYQHKEMSLQAFKMEIESKTQAAETTLKEYEWTEIPMSRRE